MLDSDSDSNDSITPDRMQRPNDEEDNHVVNIEIISSSNIDDRSSRMLFHSVNNYEDPN